MTKQQYDKWSRALAFALKLIGALGIVFVPIFWALTGRVELAFLPAFGTIAGIGQGVDALKEISMTKLQLKEDPSDES